MKVFVAVLLLAAVACGEEDKVEKAPRRVYGRCELARDLASRPFFRPRVADWFCLIEHESSFNSGAIGPPNTDGSTDWGLFQINDRYWCGANSVAGDCNINCHSFLVDDGIGAAQSCVELIYSRHGFDAWYGWQRGCLNGLPDLGSECGIFFTEEEKLQQQLNQIKEDSDESGSSESNSSESDESDEKVKKGKKHVKHEKHEKHAPKKGKQTEEKKHFKSEKKQPKKFEEVRGHQDRSRDQKQHRHRD